MLHSILETFTDSSNTDSLMILVERACIKDPLMRESNELDLNETNDYSLECENAVKSYFDKGKCSL